MPSIASTKKWIISKTINKSMCAECGGECCKRCGCSYFAEDLDMNFENLQRKISSRKISIDCLTHNENFVSLKEPVYYLRVSNINEKPIAIGALGRCSRLTKTGCSLSYINRPSGGKLFVPFWSGCYPLYSQQEFIQSWIPHQKLLLELIDFFSNL